MTASEKGAEKEKRHEEWDRLSLLLAGFFLALVGVILMITPNYYDEAVAFVKDFKVVEVPFQRLGEEKGWNECQHNLLARGWICFNIAINSNNWLVRLP